MEEHEHYQSDLRRNGRKASWENFNTAPRHNGATPGSNVVHIIRSPKNSAAASSQPQSAIKTHSALDTGSLWPVYGIFLFAFGMLGYVSYNLMY